MTDTKSKPLNSFLVEAHERGYSVVEFAPSYNGFIVNNERWAFTTAEELAEWLIGHLPKVSAERAAVSRFAPAWRSMRA